MLDLRAAYEAPPRENEPAPIRINLPDGRTLHAADADASELLSAELGREVAIERMEAGQHTRAGIDPGTIFGDVPIENVMPQLNAATMPDSFSLVNGTFFDSATMHVLATGTLAHMRALVGDGAQLDARRFRPNIVVDTGTEAQRLCRGRMDREDARSRRDRSGREDYRDGTGVALRHDHASAGRPRARLAHHPGGRPVS